MEINYNGEAGDHYSYINPYRLVDLCMGRTPSSLKQFADIFRSAGLPEITRETVPFNRLRLPTNHSDYDDKYNVPSFSDLGKSR